MEPGGGGIMKAKIIWEEGLTFQAELDGFKFHVDVDSKSGGHNKGPRPKGLTLISLAGCSGMDVISILKKMRVEVDHFEIETEAKLAEDHPKKIEEIIIRYHLTGENIPEDKVKKAVTLSDERYCGVSATLKPQVKISHEIIINQKTIEI